MCIRQIMLPESRTKMSITVLPLTPSEVHNFGQTTINFYPHLCFSCENPEDLVYILREIWVLWSSELSISISLIVKDYEDMYVCCTCGGQMLTKLICAA